MAKICEVTGCMYPVFGTDKITGKHYCGRHQYKRTDLKKKRQEKADVHREDWITYEKVWNTQPHECFECGEPIPAPIIDNFHHVLPKGELRYKHLRHKVKNIKILCCRLQKNNCHGKVTNGIKSAKMIKCEAETIEYFKGKGLL